MNFPFYIARRYLFSKKSHNAINIISMVSVCGVVVATMALVCALSVLNGFVGLVSSMLGNFDPELKIQPVHGKVFDPTLPAVREVKELPEVALFCEVLQDNAQVRYRDRQITATVKGVDGTFGRLTRIDSILVDSREGEKEVSAIELSLVPGADINSVKSRIKSLLGDDFSVKDRYEQQEASFRMMQGEKWMIFLILCFILILALFNVIGSLSMLMIEKKEDVRTLRNMGADDRLIRRIFLFEGWMISGLGALIGIVIGLALCLLQQELGIIKLGQAAGSFIIDAYPVRVEASDILIVFITVLSIGFLAAWYPVHYLGKKWLTR